MIKTGCTIVTCFGNIVAKNVSVTHVENCLTEEIGLCCVNMIPLLVCRKYDQYGGDGTWYVGMKMDSKWRQNNNTPFDASYWSEP